MVTPDGRVTFIILVSLCGAKIFEEKRENCDSEGGYYELSGNGAKHDITRPALIRGFYFVRKLYRTSDRSFSLKVSADFCGQRMSRSQRNGSLRQLISVF
jgi:hypothetical protein